MPIVQIGMKTASPGQYDANDTGACQAIFGKAPAEKGDKGGKETINQRVVRDIRIQKPVRRHDVRSHAKQTEQAKTHAIGNAERP